jgi:hypothetical protein
MSGDINVRRRLRDPLSTRLGRSHRGFREPSFLTAALTVDPNGIAAVVGFYASKPLRVLTEPQTLSPSL